MSREARRFIVPLAFLAFVSLGLPDGVLGVAWPSVRRSFDRPIDQLGLVLLAMMAGYLASSFSAGAILARWGVGRLLVTSSLLVAASAAVWATTRWWLLIVAGAFVSGLGAGAIDAAINAFAAARFTPRVMTWLHACWGLGAMIGPLVMTAVITSGHGWRRGYLLLATSLLGMAACFHLTLGLWQLPATMTVGSTEAGSVAGRRRDALREPRVRGNALLFFLYTGAEASAGQWAYRSSPRRAAWARPRPASRRPPTGAASSPGASPSASSCTTWPRPPCCASPWPARRSPPSWCA